MITTTATEGQLTQVKKNAFGDNVEMPVPADTLITWWMTEPKSSGTGVDMAWTIELLGWFGDHTQKESEPSVFLKEVSSKYKIKLFTEIGQPKYPFIKSEKEYVQGMVEDQTRLLISFLYENDIFPEGSLTVTGI